MAALQTLIKKNLSIKLFIQAVQIHFQLLFTPGLDKTWKKEITVTIGHSNLIQQRMRKCTYRAVEEVCWVNEEEEVKNTYLHIMVWGHQV